MSEGQCYVNRVMSSKADPTVRFSKRVEHYVVSRPSYPEAVLDALEREVGFKPSQQIADIGCGTGLLAELFLRRGAHIVGVEPNQDMREAGKRFLAAYPRFRAVDGRAEATTLDEASVDGIVAGQSFHWFDPEPTRQEFARILAPKGWVALIWNRRRIYSTPFLADYEALVLEHGIDYRQVDHTKIKMEEIRRFFGHPNVQLRSFDNEQRFDFDSLSSRVHSSSYMPQPDHPGHEAMISALRRLFDQYEVDGTVRFEYDTLVYFGLLD